MLIEPRNIQIAGAFVFMSTGAVQALGAFAEALHLHGGSLNIVKVVTQLTTFTVPSSQ